MKFRSHLYALAKQSQHHRYMHAALVAKGKSIIGFGVNTEGHHAEANALYNSYGRTKGATLYTLMLRRKTQLIGNGTPCPICMNLIAKAKIRRVILYV